MQFTTKFIPKITDLPNVKFGELLVLVDEQTSRLVLVVEGQSGDKRGAILAEWGVSSGAPVPNSGLLLHLQDATHAPRLIEGDLIVEAVIKTEHDMFLRQNYKNGALAVFQGGEMGLRIASERGPAWVWSLSSGKLLDMTNQPPKYWLDSWRLIWRDGADKLTLCEIKN